MAFFYNDQTCDVVAPPALSCEDLEMEWQDMDVPQGFIMWNNYPTQRWKDFPVMAAGEDLIEFPLDRGFDDVDDDDSANFIPPPQGSDGWPDLDQDTENGQSPSPWFEEEEDKPEEELTPPFTSPYTFIPIQKDNTFFIPTQEDEEEIWTLPLNYRQLNTLTTRYTDKSPFFTRFFKQQIEMRGLGEYVELMNEHLRDQQRHDKGTPDYWYHQFFGYKRYRDELVKYFNDMTVHAHAEIREDTTEKEVNTTFVDQREETSDQGFMQGQVSTPGNGISMPENEYHIRTVMAKPILTFTSEWTAAMEEGHYITELLLPGDFIQGPHYNLLSTFIFTRFVVELRFEINSNKFNKGYLVAAFIPQFQKASTAKSFFSADNILGFPHGKIDASLSNTVTLRIPFAHTHTYFNTNKQNDYEYLGRVVLVVFNRLGSTTGAPSTVDVSCWTSFKDAELHQPSEAHTVILPSAHAGVEGIVKSALPFVKDLIAPGASSSVGGVMGGAANCDFPSDPSSPQRWVPNAVPAMNYGEGLDRTTRLSLRPGTATVHQPEMIQTTQDDMQMKSLVKVASRIATFTVSTGDGPGSVVGVIPCYPTLAVQKQTKKAGDADVDVYDTTILGYFSRSCKFYRGGLTYTFMAAVNQMTSVRFQISFIPGNYTTNFDKTKYYNVLYWDVQEKHEISVTAPYMSERPWLRCDRMVARSELTTFDPSLSYGTIVIHVVNRLTVPDATSTSVDISVLVAAADDFELAFPTDLSLYQGSGDVLPRAHSLAETVTTREENNSIVLINGVGMLKNVTESTMSEGAMDMKTACRRYQKVFENTVTIDENSVISFVNTPLLGSVNKRFNNNNGIQFRTLLAHYGESMTFHRGSLRYILVVHGWDTSKAFISEILHTPGVFTNNFTPSNLSNEWVQILGSSEVQGVMVGSSQIQASWSFEIPFYTAYQQLKTLIESTEPGANWTARTATGTVFIRCNGEKSTKYRISLYQAAGDDFTYNYFRSVPRVQFLKDAEKNRQTDDDSRALYNPNYLDYPGGITPTRQAWMKTVADTPENTPNTLTKTVRTQINSTVHAHAGGFWETTRSYFPRNPYTTAMNTLESITQAANTAENTVQGISTRLGLSTAAEVEKADEGGIFTSLNSFLQGLPSLVGSGVGIAGNIAVLVAGFQAYLTAESTFVKGCAIVAILRELFGGLLQWSAEKLTQMAISIIEGIVNGCKQGNQQPGVQAQAELVEFVPAIVGVATAALVVLGFKSIPNDKETTEMCKTVSERLRLFNFSSTAISNVKGLYKQMKELTEWIVEQVLLLTAPQYLAQLKLQEGFQDIEVFALFVDETYDTDYKTRSQFDREFKMKCLQAADQAEVFNRLRIRGKLGASGRVLAEYIRKAKEIGLAVREAWKELPVRVDPLCICIKGVTAVGKSAGITSLAFKLMDNLGYPVEGRWCPHNPAEEFFTENYTGQDAIYMDDISLFKDQKQYAFFSMLKSNAKLPLVMAFKKGQLFTSDFIFMTTNTAYPAPNECNDVVALQRRRDVLIEARWVSEEVQRQVVMEGRTELRRNFDHMRFRILPSVEPRLARQRGLVQRAASDWMCYADLLREVEVFANNYFTNQDRLIRDSLRVMHIPIPEEYDRQMEERERRVDALAEEEARLRDAEAGEEVAAIIAVNEVVVAEEDFQEAEDNIERFLNQDLGEIPPVEPVPEARNLLMEAEAMAGEDDIVLSLSLDKAHDQPLLSTVSDESIEAVVYSKEMKKWVARDADSVEEANELLFLLDEERRKLEEAHADTEFKIAQLKDTRSRTVDPQLVRNIDLTLDALDDVMAQKTTTLESEMWRCVKKSRMARFKAATLGKLEQVKNWLKDQWTAAKEALPWLKCLESWPAKLVAVAVAIFGLTGLIVKTAHKCYCHSMRYMGYRCHFCGRGPVLDHNLNQSWILREWQRIYGDEEYEPGRITKKEEEEQYFDVLGEKPQGIFLGTKKSCEAMVGPYSDVTRGAALHHVVPHLGPYSDVTKGAALNHVVAHSGRPMEVANNRVIPALYRVRTVTGLQMMSLNALAIGGKKLIMNKHFLDVAKKNGEFQIWHSNEWLRVQYDEDLIVFFENKDLAVVEVPSIQMHKDMTGHFIEEASLGKYKKTAAMMIEQTSKMVPVIHETTAVAIDEMKYTMTSEGKTETYLTRGMWKYESKLTFGACGSVLMTTENKSNGMILGIHTAGDVRTGYAALITREMVAALIGKGRLGTPIPAAHFLVSPMVPEGHFGHIGQVERGVFQSDKTTIIPTAIHGMVAPPVTEPAVLSSRDPRLKVKKNIMKSGIAKYGKAPVEFSKRHRAMISESVRESMEAWTLQREPQILTDEEALCGIDGMEGFDRLPLNTSPGYPWVLSRPKGEVGKAYLFDIGQKRISDTELKKKFEMREALARRGERVESVWTCCLKDERRPLAKIAEGSTRLFIIPPVDYSLLERKYMQDYSVALKDNRRISPSKVGIDPQSLEWTELYNYIAEFSSFVFAGDFQRFDGTLAPDLTTDFYRDGNYFYKRFGKCDEGDSNVRETLCDEGIHTICLANDVLFMTHTGNKSGNPNTVNKNGDVNFRYIALAYLGLAEELGKLATMAEFHKNVRVACYGDDNIVAVKAEVIEWFNQQTVTQFLARYGIVYTNATKSGEVLPYISLEEMTFLKQSFRDHSGLKGVKVPHMAENTILELCNWTRIAPDQDELLESNCNDALRFAYFRGFEYFTSLRQKIAAALKARGKKLRVMTYSDFHYWFLFVCGALPCHVKCQAMFEKIAASGNGVMTQKLMKLVQKIPYAITSMTGVLSTREVKDKTDNRYAIAIPSGEGKSWLCKHYPHLFVDHDAILLPEASRRLKEKGLNWKHLWEMLEVDYPVDDRRILLVHHPNNTRRKMLGCYKLPKPNFIRANAYQRARMPADCKVMNRDERNEEILKLITTMEPNLGKTRGLTATTPLISQVEKRV
ncbi:hypothetical protein [Hubei picorna-like virus 48]|uniref:hypothetical protein n=1 Tax=Hubei picorna-like virus 48 TaxID=1923129 RepID=UPI0009094FF0|nr:hypothetical protein [Hubei picorna-like virus 48]APG77411.1 hypothetical protein [Hubei picorna-like virus 48]